MAQDGGAHVEFGQHPLGECLGGGVPALAVAGRADLAPGPVQQHQRHGAQVVVGHPVGQLGLVGHRGHAQLQVEQAAVDIAGLLVQRAQQLAPGPCLVAGQQTQPGQAAGALRARESRLALVEAVKGIVKNNAFLKELDGKTIKIVAPLVTFIDLSLEYRVVFMIRELDEVLQSQGKMLGKDQQEQQEKFRSIYTLHVEKSRQFLRANNISFIEIQHRELLKDPETTLQNLIDFCSWETPMEELNSVIDQSLYRNRKNA